MSEHARVLFFATLREKTGLRETTIEFSAGARIMDIKQMLVERFPEIKQNMETIIVAVNREFAFDEDLVVDGAEIALFPPVSGGADRMQELPIFIDIVENEIDIPGIIQRITLPSTGGTCVFTGIVRGITRREIPHQTEQLEYEAYRSMAIIKLRQIVGEIRSRWNEVEGIALVQRTGILRPGMISVVVACGGAHRDTGIFEAARYGIDRIKEIVPIWKKEISPQGEEWIEGDYHPERGE